MDGGKDVTLFIGSGKVEERGRALKKQLEKMGYYVLIVPISDEGVLELSSGGYIYSGHEIDLIEKIEATA